MSYNTLASAKAIVGVDLSQTLLDEAQSMINNYTSYRWESTQITITRSGRGMQPKNILFLSSPVISVQSLVVDTNTWTEGTEFDVRKEEGILDLLAGAAIDDDNIVLQYTYGFTSSHYRYNDTINLVLGAEARIALYLKRNPLMTPSLGVTGANVSFAGVLQNDALNAYLMRVPTPQDFGV